MEKLHMQYDTIMGMLFYEFQNVLETYSQILEERKEAEKFKIFDIEFVSKGVSYSSKKESHPWKGDFLKI